MRKSSKFLAGLLLAASLVLSGCASDSGRSSAELSAADQMFLEMMIPHHNQAVQMSHLAETNTKNPKILALAKIIDEEQLREIDLMSGWLGEGVGQVNGHQDHTMDGMLTTDQMEALGRAKDTEFDRLFLAGMILHHEGAIEMTQMVTGTENQQVKQLAESIIKSQTEQIRQMKYLLADFN